MIAIQDIVNRCQQRLDSEGSDYYTFDNDYLPAIQSAQDFVIQIIDGAFQAKKFTDDVFNDLVLTRVFQSSVFSRIQFNSTDLGHELWTILSVEPNPTTSPIFSPTATINPQDSKYRPDLAHIQAPYYAARMTIEEWNKNRRNPFAEGHDLDAGETATSYAYLTYNNYTGSNYTLPTTNVSEIEIRPNINRGAATVRYARYPSVPTLITENLMFPKSLTNLIVAKALNYISVKQGDNTTLYSTTAKEIEQIVASIV